MLHLPRLHEPSVAAKILDDARVCLLDGKARIRPGLFREAAPLVNGRHHRQLIAKPHLVVLMAVAGGDVHRAAPLLHAHHVVAHQRHLPAVQGMGEHRPQQLEAKRPMQGPGLGLAQKRRHRAQAGFGDDHPPARKVRQHVTLVGVDGHRLVGGQGPRGGGPDDDLGRCSLPVAGPLAGQAPGQLPHRETHIDAGRAAVAVFDLRLGQRGLTARAPVDGLQAAVDVPPAGDAAKQLHLPGLVGGVQGEVGLLPVPPNTQALELLALDLHKLQRVLPAAPAELHHRHLVPVQPRVLDDLMFDGKAMGVPPGDVRCPHPLHGPHPHDHVLEDLVEGGTQMDVAVGIGRPVMQHEAWSALRPAHLLQAGVQPLALPCGQDLGFPAGQVGLHGKPGPG